MRERKDSENLNRHAFEHTLEVGDGQGSLACCSPWGRRVGHDWVTELSWNNRACVDSVSGLSLVLSGGSSHPKNRTGVSCIVGRFFTELSEKHVYRLDNYKSILNSTENYSIPCNDLVGSRMSKRVDLSVCIAEHNIVNQIYSKKKKKSKNFKKQSLVPTSGNQSV